MADTKYLFGVTPVVLEPISDPPNDYTHALVNPNQALLKTDLENGMCTLFPIERSYWKALPDVGINLALLNWRAEPLYTVFEMEFSTSPLFDRFSDFITAYKATLTSSSDEEVLTDTEGITITN